MFLSPGTRVGTYEVIETLGSGGMGEVYRARDAKLRRDVALKVLPAPHRLDTDRQARFAREALSLATLNHPNIATVHGVEVAEGVQALVMELVEGQTLADRLERHVSGLPIAEVLAIARQLADALEAAHAGGLVHRDLKPANIKIRPDGVVKILDFGIAKALETYASANDANVPTLTAEHTVVGTPAYMSPEQARGQSIDQRTDIWAFGCVLYEMLTGQRAFTGSTSSDTIAAVLDREPDYDRLPQDSPPLVRRLVKRCLEKDPRRRLRDIADARLDLDDASSVATMAVGTAAARPWRAARLWFPIACVVAGAAAATLAIWLWPRSIPVAEPMQLTALLPPGVTVTRGPARQLSLALSPDGRTLVIAGTDGDTERLYVRTRTGPEAMPLAGTEGGVSPFFSPDGTWVGFFADRRLKRVPLGGGAAVDIAPAPSRPAGASWGANDRIVFAGYQAPLQVVEAAGGTPEDVLSGGAEWGQLFPEFLPDGRTVLFTEGGSTSAVDLVSKRRTDRILEGIGARYLPRGHVLLNRGNLLLAAPFDAVNLRVTGPLVPLVEGVDFERTTNGAAQLAISTAGTIAFVPSARAFELVLLGPDGGERLLAEHLMLENPRFSPNGRQLAVAVTRNSGERPDVWIHDLTGGSPAYRLTSEGGRAPVWTRDGASITYSYLLPVNRKTGDDPGLYNKSADGRGSAQRIMALPRFNWLVGWTPDQALVYGMMEATAIDRAPASSIFLFEGAESTRVVGPGAIWGGRLSPDGRWLVYYSLDSGYFEIYVTPFPNTGVRSLIAEGTDPAWSPDGSEIYYRAGSRLMAARVETSPAVRVLSQRLVVEPFIPPLYDDYDVHPDGRTLALVRPAGGLRGREITLLLNWEAELERLMPR